ncbi:MAG: DUF3467 domain-containing protein [Candidatus Rokuibacteriota bacterium]
MADDVKGSDARAESGKAGGPTLRIDTSSIASTYANTCYASSTREEVVLNFGLNQSWERGQKEIQVQLTNRIILSPYAAKRLAILLTSVVQQHETRFGPLDVTASGPAPAQPDEPKLRPVKR